MALLSELVRHDRPLSTGASAVYPYKPIFESKYKFVSRFGDEVHGIGYHRATYWVGIYNDLVEAGVPWDKVKSIGWTKLKEIAKVITNENVDEWVALATKMNTISLIDTVKAHLNKDKPVALEDQSAKTVTTKTFKVHADQKVTIEAAIEKAKGISGTAVDTAALEFVCLDFLGGQSLVEKFKSMGIEAVLGSVEKAFPNAKIDVELTETGA